MDKMYTFILEAEEEDDTEHFEGVMYVENEHYMKNLEALDRWKIEVTANYGWLAVKITWSKFHLCIKRTGWIKLV